MIKKGVFDRPHIGKNARIGKGVKVEANFAYVGNGAKIGDGVRLGFASYVGSGCVIGRNSALGHHTVLFKGTVIGHHTVIGALCSSQGDNVIGNHVRIINQSQIGRRMVIEDYVSIGPRFVPSNTKNIVHHRNIPRVVDPTTVEFGARIGSGVTLCPGVIIGREAFIGAGSVVTKSIPPFKVAYGNPARVVRDVPENEYLPEKFYKQFLKENG